MKHNVLWSSLAVLAIQVTGCGTGPGATGPSPEVAPPAKDMPAKSAAAPLPTKTEAASRGAPTGGLRAEAEGTSPGAGTETFYVESEGLPPNAAKDVTNSIGMSLKLIPAGEFLMGSGESAEDTAESFKVTVSKGMPADLFKDEHPQHRVCITRAFYLGVYHVTRGQFQQFVTETGYQTDAEQGETRGAMGLDLENSQPPNLMRYGFFRDRSWQNVGYRQPLDHPVVNVSWNDAVAFCGWLSRKERRDYRLPTEAEWEYACRAGSTTRYYSGDGYDGVAQVGAAARFVHDGNVDEYVFTAPIGALGPNAFGLYDMHGNARQWCADWYSATYYGTSPLGDPAGPTSGAFRVVRGSCSQSVATDIRCASRGQMAPYQRDYRTGFRVARSD